MQSFIKCIQSTLPRAENAIFAESSEGNLFYRRIEYDFERELNNESGHIVTRPGDSGSPLWTTQEVGNEKRAALVAVVLGGTRSNNDHVFGEYLKDPKEQCRNYAIKITRDMRDWLDNIEKPFRKP